jgi:ATP-dependent exoDNAse (exonuclease V) alpha subunit
MELKENWNWVETSSPMFTKALDMVFNTNDNLFIMGPGGVGKSILLRMVYDHFKDVLVMGSTGISAANLVMEDVPAATIHSTMCIPPLAIYQGMKVTNKTRSVLTKAKIILIDEVSMVNASLMDLIISIVINAPKALRPRVILFGDIFQLPPVAPKEYTEEYAYFEKVYGGKYFFFNAKFYKHMEFKNIHLDEVYRQKDQRFKEALFRIRVGKQTREDLDFINTRVIKCSEHMNNNPVLLYLASTNAVVNGLNERYVSLPVFKEKKRFIARLEGEFQLSRYPHLDEKVELAIGQQVMCIANNSAGGYQNGTLGVVEGITTDSVQVLTSNDMHVIVQKHTWKQYKFFYNEESGKVDYAVSGAFTQIGCKPAYAVTFHKSQGLTLDALYVDLNSSWMPESGLYLALSRCRSLEGIGLSRAIRDKDIIVNKEALEFMETQEFVSA